jgi:hypothetical protein
LWGHLVSLVIKTKGTDPTSGCRLAAGEDGWDRR